MSEYPKALKLYGKTSLLGPDGATYYRVDSPEDEEWFRKYHEQAVADTRRELEDLLRHGND